MHAQAARAPECCSESVVSVSRVCRFALVSDPGAVCARAAHTAARPGACPVPVLFVATVRVP